MNKILCFFNFRSPYAYIGVKKAINSGIDLEYIPLCYLPREILESFSDPLVNPYKSTYLFEDSKRLFGELDIEMASNIAGDCNWPAVHSAWLCANDNGYGVKFMMEAYKSRWERGLNLEDVDVIINICDQIGFESNLAIDAMKDKDLDARLKSYTKLMRKEQIFGVPTFVYDGERFWGQDRVESLLIRLKSNN